MLRRVVSKIIHRNASIVFLVNTDTPLVQCNRAYSWKSANYTAEDVQKKCEPPMPKRAKMERSAASNIDNNILFLTFIIYM